MGRWCVPWKSTRKSNVFYHHWSWLAGVWTYSFNIHAQAVVLRPTNCVKTASPQSGWSGRGLWGCLRALAGNPLSGQGLHALSHAWVLADWMVCIGWGQALILSLLHPWRFTPLLFAGPPQDPVQKKKSQQKSVCGGNPAEVGFVFFNYYYLILLFNNYLISFSCSSTHGEGTTSTSIIWIAWHFDSERMKAFRNSPIKIVLVITKYIY